MPNNDPRNGEEFYGACSATGAGHSFGPHGPLGMIQCEYCGAPDLSDQAQPNVPIPYSDLVPTTGRKPRVGTIAHYLPQSKTSAVAAISEALRDHYREQHMALYSMPDTPGELYRENFSPHHSVMIERADDPRVDEPPRAVGKSPLFAMDFGNAEARITSFIEHVGGEVANWQPGVFSHLVAHEYPTHWWGRDAQIWSLWHQHKITWQERQARLEALHNSVKRRYAK
jgi:hypothetical protein